MAVITAMPPVSNRDQPRATVPATAHLVGIGGAGMTALAEILCGLGWQVSGSDEAEPCATGSLRRRGVMLYADHQRQHVPRDADVVVYSAAVAKENPERQAAADWNIPQLSYPEMLGRLMQSRQGICIAGSHGKSTTTAMTAHILKVAGLDPTAAVGAQVRDWQSSGRAGRGPWFVAESCEYQGNFLHLQPTAAAILGIEHDHFDCYAQLDDLVEAFRRFAQSVPATGIVFARDDCPRTTQAVRGIAASVRSFSHRRGADWWATDFRPFHGRYRFRVFHRGRYHCEIKLGIAGQHNVLNALAATALADWAGVSVRDIREALQEFHGLQRRFEIVGSWRGVTLVNDYAHHPTEVRATLRTAREVYGQRRIWCVFQPHQFSRTAALRDEFARSFGDADCVLINDIYGARETGAICSSISAEDLAAEVARFGVSVLAAHRRADILRTLQEELQPGDVLITMGAGDVGNLCHAFLEGIPRHHFS